jgi:putative transposase
MIDEAAPLSVRRQCELLNVARSRYYRGPSKESEENLKIMEHMDALHLEDPAAGARKLALYLRDDGFGQVGRRRVRRLMELMGIEAIYCRPRTSRPGDGRQIYPYLLRKLKIDRPDLVWCTDITYVPMEHGFMYLTVIMDWYSRKVLAWEISNTLDVEFCLRALKKAIARAGTTPEIMNTDQGAQYTCERWITTLDEHGIKISMDGKGRWRDNIVVERFWRTVKYDDIYIWRYADGLALSEGLERFICRYNDRRPHDSLGGAKPSEVYSGAVQLEAA